MKNRYSKSSKLSEARFRAVVKSFAADLTALQTAQLCGVNRNTVNQIYRGLRERIFIDCEAKRPFFGIYERDGQVYTEIVSDCSKPTLQGIIRGRVDPSTVVNSDGWRGYNGLVDLSYGHFRVDHAKDEFARGSVHINGIEGFWGTAKVRLAKFKGVPKHTFHLHLKETEWCFNHRGSKKVRILLRYLRENPLR